MIGGEGGGGEGGCKERGQQINRKSLEHNVVEGSVYTGGGCPLEVELVSNININCIKYFHFGQTFSVDTFGLFWNFLVSLGKFQHFNNKKLLYIVG